MYNVGMNKVCRKLSTNFLDELNIKFEYNEVIDFLNDKGLIYEGVLEPPKGKLPVSLNKFKCGYGLEFSGFLTPETLPVSLIDNKYTHQIDSLVLNAIEQRAFPGCQVLALKEGKIIYDKNYGKYTYEGVSPVHYDAVYDIASLTKVFASTFAMMKLYDDGKIDLNSTLGDYFPFMNQSDKGDIKLIELLTHSQGSRLGFQYISMSNQVT